MDILLTVWFTGLAGCQHAGAYAFLFCAAFLSRFCDLACLVRLTEQGNVLFISLLANILIIPTTPPPHCPNMNVSCKKKTSIERNCEISGDFCLLSVNILNCPQHSLLVLCDVTHRAVQEHKIIFFIWVEVAQ